MPVKCRISSKSELHGGCGDANLAEMLTIREALALFVVAAWCQAYGLIIETNSINVVTWVSKPLSSPWLLRTLIVCCVGCLWGCGSLLAAGGLALGISLGGVVGKWFMGSSCPGANSGVPKRKREKETGMLIVFPSLTNFTF
ncbi:Uncharacterized protein TCM_019457 [Theobroma cacao]|uniref:RNase H type-1 domain-containing protein n=1 Tax=Theobroma cacao TaxID=3641 RepID=A0A061EPG3_THECC|nr:Uncharacterized protein TCM_019457 [Theobroma cacao]